jgi:Protein of unknown function (DUF3551)
MTRMSIIALFVVAVTLLGDTQFSNAQSPYSYPWCALGGHRASNALSCYYTSWEQCRATMSGIGGNCVRSPYYRAQATEPVHHTLVQRHDRRHAK